MPPGLAPDEHTRVPTSHSPAQRRHYCAMRAWKEAEHLGLDVEIGQGELEERLEVLVHKHRRPRSHGNSWTRADHELIHHCPIHGRAWHALEFASHVKGNDAGGDVLEWAVRDYTGAAVHLEHRRCLAAVAEMRHQQLSVESEQDNDEEGCSSKLDATNR